MITKTLISIALLSLVYAKIEYETVREESHSVKPELARELEERQEKGVMVVPSSETRYINNEQWGKRNKI